MYSEQLQTYLREIGQVAGIDPKDTRLLDESLSAYLHLFSRSVGGVLTPMSDYFSTTIKLLSLSLGLTEMDLDAEVDGSHYLVAMGLEQSGELVARVCAIEFAENYPPLSNDHWYRLVLAFLHYMAGGYRVQAISVLRQISSITRRISDEEQRNTYSLAEQALLSVFRARTPRSLNSPFDQYLFGSEEPLDLQGRRIFRLALKIRRRRQVALSELGQDNELDWLSARGIDVQVGDDFWQKYLSRLSERGYTNFTDEQRGEGFDDWLRPDTDLLVILPTGSGKTLIGELKTALALASGAQAVWLLPTRALVRQAKRELALAFRDLNVDVEELPTTEDFIPAFAENLNAQRLVAATTPEKMAALIRSNPNAVSNVQLIVLDEAQILIENRGTTTEHVLQEIHRLVPTCKFVLLSAFGDLEERLRGFMLKLLQKNPKRLLSNARPTRRINGVITSVGKEGNQLPTISIYPTKVVREANTIKNPFSIKFSKPKLGGKFGATDLAKIVSARLIGTELRAAVFVSTVSSTETQAGEIAKKANLARKLPDEDVSRFRVELGRVSVVEETATKRIAPHHAGLTALEQHIVEKWTRDKIINLVVATPTLAQGVNLPFDLSIVSFLKRINPATGGMERIPVPEIMNMLGRAGRAGQVSDGMCLIAIPSMDGTELKPLRSAKKYFFGHNQVSQTLLGLANLLISSSHARISSLAWLVELDGMKFDQAQALVAFSLLAATEETEIKKGLSERLALYPSIQDLVDIDNDENDNQEKVIAQLTSTIEPMVRNILDQSRGDSDLIKALSKTGMPMEVLRYLLDVLREADNDFRYSASQDILQWADDRIFESLQKCSSRIWQRSFLSEINKNITLGELRTVISLWRSGAPLAEIEDKIMIGRNQKENRINIGKLINQKMSLVAQFWGALAVCDEITYPDESRRPFELMQTFVREGVSSLPEFLWLNQIGGMDRVLAHRLAQLLPDEIAISDRQTISRFIRRRLNQWKSGEEIIPIEGFSTNEAGALRSILQEI